MNRPEFEKEIKELIAAQPFVPFAVDLVEGERVLIENPQAFRCQGGSAVYATSDGLLDIFDYRSVRAVKPLHPPAGVG
jgi:hypothetical protein